MCNKKKIEVLSDEAMQAIRQQACEDGKVQQVKMIKVISEYIDSLRSTLGRTITYADTNEKGYSASSVRELMAATTIVTSKFFTQTLWKERKKCPDTITSEEYLTLIDKVINKYLRRKSFAFTNITINAFTEKPEGLDSMKRMGKNLLDLSLVTAAVLFDDVDLYDSGKLAVQLWNFIECNPDKCDMEIAIVE